MYVIIVLFALLLLVNIFFRIKVIKSLKVLRESNIQFDAAMVFDKDKLKSFIAAQPPTNGKAISDFFKIPEIFYHDGCFIDRADHFIWCSINVL